VLLGVAVTALLLLFQQGAITVSDGQSMFQTTKALADRGSLAIPAQYAGAPPPVSTARTTASTASASPSWRCRHIC
jgi:hypothetical protein